MYLYVSSFAYFPVARMTSELSLHPSPPGARRGFAHHGVIRFRDQRVRERGGDERGGPRREARGEREEDMFKEHCFLFE